MTPAQEFLQTLVECDRYKDQYRQGLPVSGCLRRQAERQRGTKPGVLGPPTKPYCAGQCAQGRELATIAASVGVQAAPCPTCGGALIGGVACEVCVDPKAPAKGFLPAAAAEKSERIWSGEAPNVPLGRPPGSPTPGEEAAARIVARVRRPQAAPWAEQGTRDLRVDEDQEPAEPAEEETMRAERKPKECCGSLGPRCLSGCTGVAKSAKAAVPKLPPKPKASARRAAAPPRRKVLPAVDDIILSDIVTSLGDLPACDLIELRDEVLAEIRRRKEAAETALQELNTALGEAA